MISLINKFLLMTLLLTVQSHTSTSRFANWLVLFRTKISALKNSLPSFNSGRFNFKNWFFKKSQFIVPQKPTLSEKSLAKPLEIVDLTNMKFSQPEDPINNDITELKNLMNQTTPFPDQKKVLAHYTAILDKKWKALATDFEILLSFNPDKNISGQHVLGAFHYIQKKYLKHPYADEKTIKAIISDPLKKNLQKDIWLTDMLKPLNDETKKIFRNSGIIDQYLDRIFIVVHTPDPEIPFELFDEHDGAAHMQDFNSKNNIIFVNKNFFDNSISEQIFIINHEIAHCNQKQVNRRPYAKFMRNYFAEDYHPSLKYFAKTFNEMEADIVAILQLSLLHNINTLPNFKKYDTVGRKFFPDLWYPLHRYDIALTVVKSLITGQVPREIPDSWINNAGQELKNKINELSYKKTRGVKKINPQSKL